MRQTDTPRTGPGPVAWPYATRSAAVFQAASFLLDYPREGTAEDLHLIAEAIAELEGCTAKARLLDFLEWWRRLDEIEREMLYVHTFDLQLATCLYMLGRPSGDLRHHGPRLLELKDLYRRNGYEPDAEELPDYLPLMLEFSALTPVGAARLAAERRALLDLRRALKGLKSRFVEVIDAVLTELTPGARDS